MLGNADPESISGRCRADDERDAVEVDDVWAKRLMTAFYRNALEGQPSYLEALRNAQLQTLRELRSLESAQPTRDELRGADVPDDGGAAVGSPYFWAAFVLSGDWR